MLKYLMNKELAEYLTKLYLGSGINEVIIELIAKQTFCTETTKYELISHLDELLFDNLKKGEKLNLTISAVEVLPTTPGNFKINFVAKELDKPNPQQMYNTLFEELIKKENKAHKQSYKPTENKKYQLLNNQNFAIGGLFPGSMVVDDSLQDLEKYEFIMNLIMRIETHAAQLKETYKEKSVLTDYIHALEYLLKDL